MSNVDVAYRRYDTAKLTLQVITVILVLVAMFVLIRVALVNQANGRLLVECTTAPKVRQPPVKHPKPTDCYVRTHAETSDLLGEPAGPINTVTYLSVACGRVPANDTPLKILACVEKELASR